MPMSLAHLAALSRLIREVRCCAASANLRVPDDVAEAAFLIKEIETTRRSVAVAQAKAGALLAKLAALIKRLEAEFVVEDESEVKS